MSNRFTLFDIDCLLLEGEFNNEALFLHTTFKADKFTKEMYIDLLELFVITLDALKERGITEVFSFIPKDKKLMKWQEMFGLKVFIEFEDNYLYRRVL